MLQPLDRKGLAFSLRFYHRVFKRFLSANILRSSHCKPLHWGCIRCFPRRFARIELIRKLVFEVKTYLPMASSRVMLMFGIRSLQTLLGHASLNTTQIYTHITIDRLRAVHDATHPAKPDVPPLPPTPAVLSAPPTESTPPDVPPEA